MKENMVKIHVPHDSGFGGSGGGGRFVWYIQWLVTLVTIVSRFIGTVNRRVIHRRRTLHEEKLQDEAMRKWHEKNVSEGKNWDGSIDIEVPSSMTLRDALSVAGFPTDELFGEPDLCSLWGHSIARTFANTSVGDLQQDIIAQAISDCQIAQW